MTTVIVNIRNIAVGGDGVGEVIEQSGALQDLLGISAFVPFTLRRERVKAVVTQKKDRFIRAELESVELASPSRVSSACPYYGKCGGCDLQHMSYAEQLDAKLEMIRGSMRAGRVDHSVIECLKPIVPSEPFGYRRRVTLHIDTSGRVGFFQRSSRIVVPVDECVVAVPLVNEMLPKLGSFGQAVAGIISLLVLETDETGLIAVLRAPYDLDSREVDTVIEAARKVFSSAIVLAGNREVGGYGRRILELPLNYKSRLSLQVPAGFFSQVNWNVNQQLVTTVMDFINPTQGMRVLDLYAGAGNFSLPAAAALADTIAVECDEQLLRSGRQNATRLGLKRLQFVDSSVEQYLKGVKRSETFDVIIADPPRSGLGSIVDKLPRCKLLVLVFCHLPSLIRDVRAVSARGWKPKAIIPFDMFSQTSYIETLAVFNRPDM